jgi:DNA ligase (NAD+)
VTAAQAIPESHYEAMQKLKKWGFPVNAEIQQVQDAQGCIAYYREMAEKRDSLPYDIDGVVYKVDLREQQQTLGFVSRSPRWAIAQKFPAQEEITRLLGIDIQVGRSGALSVV